MSAYSIFAWTWYRDYDPSGYEVVSLDPRRPGKRINPKNWYYIVLPLAGPGMRPA
jgi:hypothetical protein